MATDAELDVGAEAVWAAIAVVLLASLGGAVVLAEWPLVGVTSDEPDEPKLVTPGDNGTQVWPYTARAHDFETRTLGINVVFHGDSEDIYTALTDRSDLEWEEEEVHEGDADSETVSHDRVEIDPEADDLAHVISWGRAEGSTRYTYFEVDGDGQWADESYQLHSGTYLGYRMHIRAYDDPQGEWTAVQVHDEHWDWFRLRHTVTGISDAQREIERDFRDDPAIDWERDVSRVPFENETADGDGWATVIRLAGVVAPFLLFGFATRTRKVGRQGLRRLETHNREIALGVGLFVLYSAVRWLGIIGEQLFAGVSPKIVAAPLYIALVVGTPAIAHLLGRGSDRKWAFTFAILGLGAAFVVDFAAMGVSVIPLRVMLHRGAVLLAIGLVAIGGAASVDAEDRPTPLVVGLGCWILALFLPLFGHI